MNHQDQGRVFKGGVNIKFWFKINQVLVKICLFLILGQNKAKFFIKRLAGNLIEWVQYINEQESKEGLWTERKRLKVDT